MQAPLSSDEKTVSVCLSVPPKLTGTLFDNHLPTHQNSLALSSTTIYPLTKTDRNSSPHSLATCWLIETEDYPECAASDLLDATGRSVEDDTQGGSVLDMSLIPGWYRFKLYGENAVMPTKCRPVSLGILIVHLVFTLTCSVFAWPTGTKETSLSLIMTSCFSTCYWRKHAVCYFAVVFIAREYCNNWYISSRVLRCRRMMLTSCVSAKVLLCLILRHVAYMTSCVSAKVLMCFILPPMFQQRYFCVSFYLLCFSKSTSVPHSTSRVSAKVLLCLILPHVVHITSCVSAKVFLTLRASLSGTFLQTLPDLVTPLKEHSIFISAQLSTDAVSALRKVLVLIIKTVEGT